MCFKYLCSFSFDFVFLSVVDPDPHDLALLDPDLYSYLECGYGSGSSSKDFDQKGFSLPMMQVCFMTYYLLEVYLPCKIQNFMTAKPDQDPRWNSWKIFLVKVLSINMSLLRLEFLSGFLPSFFRSTKCYSWYDSSFLVPGFFLYGFLKPELRKVFCKSRRACEWHVAKDLSFCQTDDQEFHLWIRNRPQCGSTTLVLSNLPA